MPNSTLTAIIITTLVSLWWIIWFAILDREEENDDDSDYDSDDDDRRLRCDDMPNSGAGPAQVAALLLAINRKCSANASNVVQYSPQEVQVLQYFIVASTGGQSRCDIQVGSDNSGDRVYILRSTDSPFEVDYGLYWDHTSSLWSLKQCGDADSSCGLGAGARFTGFCNITTGS